MKRGAWVGAGYRARNYNLPILKQMANKIKIVGITTKSGNISAEFDFLEAPVFSSITKMAFETKPDIIIVTIKSSVVSSVLDELIHLKVPFLIETTDDFSVYDKIRQTARAHVGILEQWPHMPMEQFKKRLLTAGAIGDVIAVENNFRTYDYHGSAQIRNYLPAKTNVASLKGFANTFKTESYVRKDKIHHEGSSEMVRIKTGIFENGVLLIYKFSDKHKNMPFRGNCTLNVYGTRGSIVSDCLVDGYCDINVLDTSTRETHNLKINKEFEGSTIKKISTRLPNGEQIVWENNYKNLSEHQIATAHLFEEMLCKNNFIYDANDAIQDMIIAYSN